VEQAVWQHQNSGAKNAVLPINRGFALGTTTSRIEEIPALEDVGKISDVLGYLGVGVAKEEATRCC
jgi:UDP-N-acetylglucosamine 1-carboxyvinyltransferase